MHKVPLNRSLGVFLAVWAAAPVQTYAQDVPTGCSPGAATQGMLERRLRLFVDDAFAEIRESNGLERLTEDVERAVVIDDQICDAVVARALEVYNEITEPVDVPDAKKKKDKGGKTKGKGADDPQSQMAVTREDADFAVLQYGPYYAVLILFDHGDVIVGGYTSMLVFRSDTLEFLGHILV